MQSYRKINCALLADSIDNYINYLIVNNSICISIVTDQVPYY